MNDSYRNASLAELTNSKRNKLEFGFENFIFLRGIVLCLSLVFEVSMQNAISFSYLQSNWCHIFIQNQPIALIDNASLHPITMDTKWH